MNQTRKSRHCLFYLLPMLTQINVAFSDNIHTLYIEYNHDACGNKICEFLPEDIIKISFMVEKRTRNDAFSKSI